MWYRLDGVLGDREGKTGPVTEGGEVKGFLTQYLKVNSFSCPVCFHEVFHDSIERHGGSIVGSSKSTCTECGSTWNEVWALVGLNSIRDATTGECVKDDKLSEEEVLGLCNQIIKIDNSLKGETA